MTVLTLMRPQGTAHNAPGRRYWTVAQCDPLVGRTVEIRDWYATFEAKVLGVAVNERTGFVASLALRYADGRETPAFSLNVTREIAVLHREDDDPWVEAPA